MGIRIVTDSASDLSIDVEERYSIPIVPLTVTFDNESYKDRVEISPKEFFTKLQESDIIPVTSQVTPQEFINVFKPIIDAGDEILGIFLSSELSGTYNSAMVAKETLNSDKITVLDSRLVALGEGLLVYKAAKMASEGKTVVEIVGYLQGYIDNIKAFLIMDTLEYLKKGGRLSASQAFVGGILNLKPILTFKDGKLVPLDKVRGRKKALSWVKCWLDNNSIDLSDKTVYMLHSQAEEYLCELKKILMEGYGAKDIIISEVGAIVGTHAGPGAIAFCFIDEP